MFWSSCFWGWTLWWSCWLEHRYAYLLVGVLDLAMGFSSPGKEFLLSTISCFPWSSRLFDVHQFWAHQCDLSLQEGTKWFIWSNLMFLRSPLMGLFWFFSLTLAWFTGSISSLDFISKVNRVQIQMPHSKSTRHLLSAYLRAGQHGNTYRTPGHGTTERIALSYSSVYERHYWYVQKSACDTTVCNI